MRATPVMRAVPRRLLPSTRAAITAARFSVLSLFMGLTIPYVDEQVKVLIWKDLGRHTVWPEWLSRNGPQNPPKLFHSCSGMKGLMLMMARCLSRTSCRSYKASPVPTARLRRSRVSESSIASGSLAFERGSANILLEVWNALDKMADPLTSVSLLAGAAGVVVSSIIGVIRLKKHVKNRPYETKIAGHDTVTITNSSEMFLGDADHHLQHLQDRVNRHRRCEDREAA